MKSLIPKKSEIEYVNIDLSPPNLNNEIKETEQIKPIEKVIQERPRRVQEEPVQVKIVKKKKPVRNMILLGFLICFIVLIIILGINMSWSNLNISRGLLQGNTSININTPDVSVPVNNAYNITANSNSPVYNNFTIILQLPGNITVNVMNYSVNSS